MDRLKTRMTALLAAAFAGALALVFQVDSARAADVPPLVSTAWLNDRLDDPDVLVLDVRSTLAGSGRDDYLNTHIPGAVWSEYPGYWRTTRANVTGVLPSVEKLEASLSELDVHEDRTVVIVLAGTSDLDFGAAARIYWTFKYLGHGKVAILDGGHAAWIAGGYLLESGDVVPEGDLFIADPRPELLVSTRDVAAMIGGKSLLLDSRPLDQFQGASKHADATRFGHLPGAVHFDQANFYDRASNRLKPIDQLSEAAAGLDPDTSAPVVAYCNTGHWAATSWFVLSELLGRDGITLYDDSMVGWSRQDDLPIFTPATSAMTDTPASTATN